MKCIHIKTYHNHRVSITRTFFKIIAIAIPCLGILACQSTNTANPVTIVMSFDGWQKQLKQLTYWQTKGAIAGQIKVSQANQAKKQSFHVHFIWQQSDHRYEINLFSFLGIGMTTLKGDKQSVTLTNSKEKLQATNPEALLEKTVGWSIPVQSLYYWIRGLKAPNIATTQMTLDRHNHIRALSQQGWHIDYQQYTKFGAYVLPTQMSLSYKNIKLYVVINDWQVDHDI